MRCTGLHEEELLVHPIHDHRKIRPYGWEANCSLSLKKAALMRSIIEASGQYQREPETPHLCAPLTMAQVLAIQSELSSEPQKPFTGLRSHYLAATPRAQIIRPVKKEGPDDDIILADVEIDRPSIGFQPSWEEYSARLKKLAKARPNHLNDTLPEGFPSCITGPHVWSGQDISTPEKFIVQLSGADIIEVESAIAHFKGKSAQRQSFESFQKLDLI